MIDTIHLKDLAGLITACAGLSKNGHRVLAIIIKRDSKIEFGDAREISLRLQLSYRSVLRIINKINTHPVLSRIVIKGFGGQSHA